MNRSHLVRDGAYAVALSGVLVMLVMMSKSETYIDWLGSHRPHEAQSETGEVIYFKTAHSVVYVTQAEENHVTELFWYSAIGLVLALPAVGFLRLTSGKSDDVKREERAPG